MLIHLKRTLFACFVVLFSVAGAQETREPLTLQQALQTAKKNHPLLASGQAAIEIAQGQEIQTRSPALPQITFQNTTQRANSRGGSFGASFPFTVYSSIFFLNQLVTDFGKTGEKIKSSREAVVQSQESLKSSLQQVLFNVYQFYYQVLETQAVVKVREQSVSNLEKHVQQAQAFFEVGTKPKIEVTQAQVNFSNGKLSLVQARNNFAIAGTNLKAAMGQPDFPPFQAVEILSEPEFSISLESAIQTAVQNRPDLKALLAQEEGAKAALSAARKGVYPTLSGSASYGWSGSDYPPGPISWSFGSSLNIPIFNGLLTQGGIIQSQGQLNQVVAQINNLKLAIRQNVEGAFYNLEAAKSSLKVAKDSLNLARENYELAEGRYSVGVGNFLEFTDAQVNLTQGETNEIQALANYNIVIASLRQAMGVLE